MEYDNYIAEELEAPVKPIVLCDIDGTVADCGHRLIFLEYCLNCDGGRHQKMFHHFSEHDNKFRCGGGNEDTEDICHCEKYKAAKDWRAFFANVSDDKPIESVITWVKNLPPDYEVWMVSGRSAECRDATAKWLDKYEIPYVKLLMREERDYRADDIVKQEILDKFIPIERVAFVIDDRNRVVEMWRKNGLKVYQVAEGDF